MNFTYPVEEYFNQIEAYKKLENPVFSPDDSNEKILGELERRSVMKKEISDKVNLFISEYIERFERSPELLTASDALRLSDLPDRLYPQSEPLGLDAAISLRIAVILRDHCKRIGDTDGLDAATDLYGRPYRKRKTLDDLIAEFRSGAGDRYGGEAAEALTDPEVYKKLQYLITEGRKKIYCRIYRQKKNRFRLISGGLAEIRRSTKRRSPKIHTFLEEESNEKPTRFNNSCTGRHSGDRNTCRGAYPDVQRY